MDKCIDCLISLGSDKDAKDKVCRENFVLHVRCGRSQKHWTALHIAAMFGQTKCVESLLRHGADMEARDLVLGEI